MSLTLKKYVFIRILHYITINLFYSYDYAIYFKKNEYVTLFLFYNPLKQIVMLNILHNKAVAWNHFAIGLELFLIF